MKLVFYNDYVLVHNQHKSLYRCQKWPLHKVLDSQCHPGWQHLHNSMYSPQESIHPYHTKLINIKMRQLANINFTAYPHPLIVHIVPYLGVFSPAKMGWILLVRLNGSFSCKIHMSKCIGLSISPHSRINSTNFLTGLY